MASFCFSGLLVSFIVVCDSGYDCLRFFCLLFVCFVLLFCLFRGFCLFILLSVLLQFEWLFELFYTLIFFLSIDVQVDSVSFSFHFYLLSFC